MKYSLVLIVLAASALAAPALTPRDPQRGNRGGQDQGQAQGQGQANQQDNQVATTPATTPIANVQAVAAATPAASQANSNPGAAAASPAPSAASTTSGNTGGAIPENLVPDFGVTAGIPNPNQAGSCLGLNDASIPCFCPPERTAFISRLNEIVAAGQAFGHPAQFPTDDSAASQSSRKNALTVTMQNFNGTASGVGCPKAAASF